MKPISESRLWKTGPSASKTFTPAQAAERDRLQGLLDACADGLTSDALSWMFAPCPTRAAPEVTPASGGFTGWLTSEEKQALRAYMPLQARKNRADPLDALDYGMASIATGQPISRLSERIAAVYTRSAKRGMFDVLVEALARGDLDALPQSRRDQLSRVCRDAIKVGRVLRDRANKRQASADQLAKSRRARAKVT